MVTTIAITVTAVIIITTNNYRLCNIFGINKKNNNNYATANVTCIAMLIASNNVSNKSSLVKNQMCNIKTKTI